MLGGRRAAEGELVATGRKSMASRNSLGGKPLTGLKPLIRLIVPGVALSKLKSRLLVLRPKMVSAVASVGVIAHPTKTVTLPTWQRKL